MGIALFSVASIVSSVGTWLNPPRATIHRPGAGLRASTRITPAQWAHRSVSGKSAGLRTGPQRLAATPLRVVRLSEAGAAPECAGRMRISGRMADVCAELDRLIAKEAQNLVH